MIQYHPKRLKPKLDVAKFQFCNMKAATFREKEKQRNFSKITQQIRLCET